jgi:CRP-like cAMP-binding protein
MSGIDQEGRARELARVDIFAGCTHSQRRRIAAFAKLVTVHPGRTLCRQGITGREFFVILDGEVTVTVDNTAVATLGPGCGFGEVTLLTPNGRRSATVTATTSMTTLVLERTAFAAFLEAAPSVGRGVLQESTRRLATLSHPKGLAASS